MYVKSTALFIFVFQFILFSCNSDIGETSTRLPDKNSIDVHLLNSEIKTSDNASINIEICYNRGLIPQIPDWESELKPVGIQSIQSRGEIQGEFLIRIIELRLDNLLPGDYLLNPIVVPLFENDNMVEELKSDFIPLKVNSSLINQGELIDQFGEMKSRNLLPYVIAGALCITVVTAGCCYIFFRKKRKRQVLPEKDFQRQLRKASEIKSDRDYYKALTTILKEFLDSTIFLSVQSQTTEEFIQMAEESDLIRNPLKEALFNFMRRGDRISFGKDGIPCDRERDLLFCEDFMSYIAKQVKTEAAE
ncbi:hypothetical protein [Spirochaeta isovalerica]|uniref:Uncharacterized protein n=1 Tax=Spirochaeta isovalerica TaxID=150 RepID=A0A841R4L7_9SPIO|nr:hypothetical protein [Spirochaeta isovalerica]MBB6478756.1 hypothetical protein [Spirochaeta isovalerica]